MENLKKLLLSSLVLIGTAGIGWSDIMSGGDYILTKDLLGTAGSPSTTSTDYALAFAWGEQISGDVISGPTYTITSGYYGGYFGNSQTIRLLSSQIGSLGSKTFFQDHVQVGIPYDAPIQLTFSSPLNKATIANGYQVLVVADHLGQSSNSVALSTYTLDSTSKILTIKPAQAWFGNTVYDVQVTPQIRDFDGFPLDQTYEIYFVTILDHREENIVLDPITSAAASAGLGFSSIGVLSIDIPRESLSNFSAVLLSRDPLTSPLHVDPKIIQIANDKARAAGGLYRVPLAIQELSAYDANGDLMGPLSKPAMLRINYNAGANANLIRPQTLAVWALDEPHRLWVKIPASQNAPGFHTVTAPVGQLSVFALMGGADGSASDSYAFPVPWRPHGPNAGTGSGQTGTEADGITFNALPSECTIKIYTISGDLVRELHHSDTMTSLPQEKWDVKTTHGEPVASGVYLWRVESSTDGKNGKLMVIR